MTDRAKVIIDFIEADKHLKQVKINIFLDIKQHGYFGTSKKFDRFHVLANLANKKQLEKDKFFCMDSKDYFLVAEYYLKQYEACEKTLLDVVVTYLGDSG